MTGDALDTPYGALLEDGTYVVRAARYGEIKVRVKTYPADSQYAAGQTVIATWRACRRDGGRFAYRGVAFVNRAGSPMARGHRHVHVWARIRHGAQIQGVAGLEFRKALAAIDVMTGRVPGIVEPAAPERVPTENDYLPQHESAVQDGASNER